MTTNEGFEMDEKDMTSNLNNEITNKNKGKYQPEDFDELLEMVGSTGRFQKIFLYGVLGPITALMPFFSLSSIFLLSVPDHNCKVPGFPPVTNPNMSWDAWKNLTLPTEIGPDGKERLSQCSMYSMDSNRTIVDCQYGWEYDKTNYESTIPSAYDWVCSKENYPTMAFTMQTVGSVLGVIVFGHLADRVGRKPVFFATILMDSTFRILSLFLVHNYTFYLICQFLGGTAVPLLFIAPITIAAEISGKEFRARVFSWSWIIWVAGMAALPVVAYFVRTWFLFGVITSLASPLLLLSYPFVPESPRFLLKIGRIKDAAKIMQMIAQKNGKTNKGDLNYLEDSMTYLYRKEKATSKLGGVWSLFSKRRLAINTMMLSISWAINKLVYYGITLNSSHIVGNEFLIFFILAVIELPSGYLGGVMVDKVGRRFTSVLFFAICAVSCLVAITAGLFGSIITIISMVVAKFAITATFLVVYMQGAEIFPTILRSTGSSFASLVATAINVVGPYMIYMGTVNVNLPFIAMGIASFIGLVASAFIPETMNKKLPESVKEANELGKFDKFWNLRQEPDKNAQIRNST